MTEREHLLTILQEECAEVIQRATKALRFGLYEVEPGQTETNATRMGREVADVLAVLELMEVEGVDIWGMLNLKELIALKKAKVTEYLIYSAKQGTLQIEDK